MSEKKEKVVVLPLKRYVELIEDSAVLDELYSAGVDNWDGYDEIDRNAITDAVTEAQLHYIEIDFA